MTPRGARIQAPVAVPFFDIERTLGFHGPAATVRGAGVNRPWRGGSRGKAIQAGAAREASDRTDGIVGESGEEDGDAPGFRA